MEERQHHHLEKFISIGLVVFAVGFNLWLYRFEPTATIDPNDNAFQFALVDRTNQIWDFASKKCSFNVLCFTSYLVDHWVPNWAEGYNLPFYYSHVPQILIVASYRILQLFTFHFSLFTYYHWVIYLLLSLFPLSVFLALRVIKLPWLAAGIGALLASHISTDGLYGLDPPSFLWRGYGLSSQLFAMIWLPMAIAYSYRFFEDGKWKFLNLNFLTSRYVDQNIKKSKNQNQKYQKNPSSRIQDINFFLAVFFLVATTMGHLGIGIIAIFSLVPLAIAAPLVHFLYRQPIPRIFELTKNQLTKLLSLGGTVIFFLSYWVVPIVLGDNYHNISFWDPVWKFDSYGAKETIVRLLNGDLFDWGRVPWMTILVIVGIIGAAWPRRTDTLKMENLEVFDLETLKSRHLDPGVEQSRHQGQGHPSSIFSFSLLFLFWLLMYFGRTTWGGLVDLIPGMREFHLSRFIVGIHAAGLFLAPVGVMWLLDMTSGAVTRVTRFPLLPLKLMGLIGLMGLMGLPIYKQTVEYARHNDRLIKQANENALRVKDDTDTLFATLRSLPPGRIFAGRGGWWGKDFRVAETPYYMHLSTYGLPTVLWLPETWSPNSDIEQYFSEDQAKDYDLFAIRYVAAPPKQEPQKFWKLIKEAPTWKLYEVQVTSDKRQDTSNTEGVGYFTSGVRPAIVATDKRSYGNVVRLWIQSDAHEKRLFPELTFDKNYPKATGLPNFKMLDEVTYIVPDGSKHNLFQEPPVYLPPDWEAANTTNKPIGQTIQQFNPSTSLRAGNVTIEKEEVDTDMIFKANVTVGEGCNECIVILKQSFHPNWRVTIDSKGVQPLTVFPFFIAAPVTAGIHEIVFSYEPSKLKIILLDIELLAILAIILRTAVRKSHR